jgi:YD repeat-containing protein
VSVSGSGYIDELRLYPAQAEMTTYTYSPCYGATSKTDPSGVSTYFEYDALGRLSVTRDYKRDILKTYRYNYRNNSLINNGQ